MFLLVTLIFGELSPDWSFTAPLDPSLSYRALWWSLGWTVFRDWPIFFSQKFLNFSNPQIETKINFDEKAPFCWALFLLFEVVVWTLFECPFPVDRRNWNGTKKNDKPIKERENKALWLRKLIPSYRHRDYSYHYQVFTLFEIIRKSLTKRLEEVRMKHGYEKGLEPKLQTDSIKILKFYQNLKNTCTHNYVVYTAYVDALDTNQAPHLDLTVDYSRDYHCVIHYF